MTNKEAELFEELKTYFYKKSGDLSAPYIFDFYEKLCELCHINPVESPSVTLSFRTYYKNEISRKNINNGFEKFANRYGMNKIIDTFVAFGMSLCTQIIREMQKEVKINKLGRAIEEKKNEVLDKAVSKTNPVKMYDLLELLIEGRHPQIPKYKKHLENTIAYRFFNSTFHDLKINLISLHEFSTKFDNMIPATLKDKFERFEKLYNTMVSKYLSNKTFQELYRQLKTLDNMGDLYDCLSFAKQTISSTIVSSLTKKEDFSSIQNLQDFEMEIPKGIKVLDLRGKKFKMLVTTINRYRCDLKEKDYQRNPSSKHDVASFSLISNDCLHTFRDLSRNIAFVYFNVDPNDIVHVTERDNYTYYKRQDSAVSDVRFAMMTPDELLGNSIKSKKYNEINAHFPSKLNNCEGDWSEEWGKTSFEKPQGIFCLNKITDAEINLAKEYNLPIIYYEDKRYIWEGETLPCVDNKIIYDRI